MTMIQNIYGGASSAVNISLFYDAGLPDPSQDQLEPLSQHAGFVGVDAGVQRRASLIWVRAGREQCRLSLNWPIQQKPHPALLSALPKMTSQPPHRLWLTLGFMAQVANWTARHDDAVRWFSLFDDVRQALDPVVDAVYAGWLSGPSNAAAQMRYGATVISQDTRHADPEGYVDQLIEIAGEEAMRRLLGSVIVTWTRRYPKPCFKSSSAA